MSVFRQDGTAIKAFKTDNGWLRAPAVLTRVGVFPYLLGGGKVRRELRLPEEVFKADSLASFSLVPLTDDHPREANGLDAGNTGAYAVGAVGLPRADSSGKFLEADLLVTDAAAVARIEGGKREISCGYFADLEHKPGVWTDAAGQAHPYDAIQRNIRGNHVAIVSEGRAGPECRVRMDAADIGVLVSESPHFDGGAVDKTQAQGIGNMEKVIITLDGLTFQVDANTAAAINKERKLSQDMLEAVRKTAAEDKKSAEANAARADAAEGKVKELSAKLDAATDPKVLAAAVAARVALEGTARAHLGAEPKFDGVSDGDLRKQVIAKLAPEAKLDGKSADYVAAHFDAVIALAEKRNPATEEAERKIKGDAKTPGTDPNVAINDGKTVDAKYNEAVFSAWKPKAK